MTATAFIFARGGSKGVKNKNIFPAVSYTHLTLPTTPYV